MTDHPHGHCTRADCHRHTVPPIPRDLPDNLPNPDARAELR